MFDAQVIVQVCPTGISYADREVAKNGDYKRSHKPASSGEAPNETRSTAGLKQFAGAIKTIYETASTGESRFSSFSILSLSIERDCSAQFRAELEADC